MIVSLPQVSASITETRYFNNNGQWTVNTVLGDKLQQTQTGSTDTSITHTASAAGIIGILAWKVSSGGTKTCLTGGSCSVSAAQATCTSTLGLHTATFTPSTIAFASTDALQVTVWDESDGIAFDVYITENTLGVLGVAAATWTVNYYCSRSGAGTKPFVFAYGSTTHPSRITGIVFTNLQTGIFAETIKTADSFTAIKSLRRVFTEVVKIADGFTGFHGVFGFFSEIIKTADSYSALKDLHRLFNETIRIGDSMFKGLSRIFTETIKVADYLGKNYLAIFTEIIKVADNFIFKKAVIVGIPILFIGVLFLFSIVGLVFVVALARRHLD